MTDNTDPSGQNPVGDEGQNPNANNDSNGNGQNPAPTGFDALPEATKTEIKNLRKEAEKYRKQVEGFENANKSELQKREDALKAAEDRATAAETKLRDANARGVVTDAAAKVNAISPRAVYHLIKSDLTFDDGGEPTNVDALIKAAQKDEPSLFPASNGSGDGGKGGDQNPHGTKDINFALREMARGAH